MSARRLTPRTRSSFSKVPEVTAFFWIVKALTTGMGESTSDFLVHGLVPEIAVVLGGIAFVIALYLQFSSDRYVPWRYWLAVAMVGVFGTMCADVLHVGLGVPYVVSTIFYAIVLAVVFRTWYRTEGTLSIHSITTERREVFYWAAVLATFALGTAAGDLTAVTFGLGFFGSGLIFAAIIAIPAIGYFRYGMNSILAFWFAYVVTRPLGASFADWLAVSSARGGLAIGTGLVSFVLAAMIAMFVAFLTSTGIDMPADQRDVGERESPAAPASPRRDRRTRFASRPNLFSRLRPRAARRPRRRGCRRARPSGLPPAGAPR